MLAPKSLSIPRQVLALTWGGMLAVLVAHMAGPCLPPALTVALFVGLALHC